MENKQQEIDAEKVTCVTCGAPALRHRTMTGTTITTAVSVEVLDQYFGHRQDINQFIYDRLQRAERIITDLRAENRILKAKIDQGS